MRIRFNSATGFSFSVYIAQVQIPCGFKIIGMHLHLLAPAFIFPARVVSVHISQITDIIRDSLIKPYSRRSFPLLLCASTLMIAFKSYGELHTYLASADISLSLVESGQLNMCSVSHMHSWRAWYFRLKAAEFSNVSRQPSDAADSTQIRSAGFRCGVRSAQPSDAADSTQIRSAGFRCGVRSADIGVRTSGRYRQWYHSRWMDRWEQAWVRLGAESLVHSNRMVFRLNHQLIRISIFRSPLSLELSRFNFWQESLSRELN